MIELETDSEEPHPAVRLAHTEALGHVQECIGLLEEMDRRYLQGHLIKGLTFRQAAASNGISLGQFKHRYEKALQQVRECMRAKGHDF